MPPPPFPSAAEYRLRLREAAGELVWQSGPVAPDASGRVTLSVHSSRLAAADYVVELDAMTPDGESPVAGFAFRVRREE
jgi:hypothetical protein